jgi:hypothetical protein
VLQNMASVDVPVTAALGGVNGSFHLSDVDCCYYEVHLNARRILKREWKAYYCIAKQDT